MDYFKLQGTDIEISQMSMGTWGFSGAKLWGASDDNVSIDTIRRALDAGINLYDTAERYGDGRAEEVLGKALKGRRPGAVIATKVYTASLGYEDVISHCEGSLKRLDTDYIDIYMIHWPSRVIPFEETMSAFEKLKKDGKIRAIGVCNHGVKCLEGVKNHKVVLNQLPYSLIWRVIEKEVKVKTIENNTSIWAYSPLAQGLLTGKYKSVDDVPMERRETRFYSGKWQQGRHDDKGFEKEIFEFLPKLQKIADEAAIPMSALALAFLKSRSGMGSVLIGSRNARQLEQNLKAFETRVPVDVIKEITELSEGLKSIMGENPDLWENKDGGRMF